MAEYKKSQALYQQAKEHLAGGVSSNFRYTGYGESPVPLFYAHGKGAHLTDVDGNDYIDYALGNGPIILGHAPAQVIKAVSDTLSMGQLFAGQHELELELAQLLTSIVPCADLVRFTSSGSESVHAALRLARAYTGRSKIVKFEGHYHGWFDNIFISVSPSHNEAGPASAPIPVSHTPGQPSSNLEDVIVLPWNDLDILASTIREHADEIAGVIMEPIMFNSGTILPMEGYLEGVRELTSEYGIVLIFDEVITGFRVALSGAQGLLGVTPDLTVFAKAMAAGFPLAAVAGHRDVMEIVDTRKVMHGGTYNGNVVSMAAGIATLKTLAQNDGQVYRDMNAKGERLISELRQLAKRHGHSLLIQGLGSVFHSAFTNQQAMMNYRDYIESDADKRNEFCARLQNAGVRLTARGTWLLSAAHTDEDIDQSINAADRALSEMKP